MTREYRIIKNAARCKICDEVLESKHVHDFKMCSGKHMFIDGGKDYIRRGGNQKDMEDLSEYEKVTSP